MCYEISDRKLLKNKTDRKRKICMQNGGVKVARELTLLRTTGEQTCAG